MYSKMILACLILAKARQFAKISSRQNYPLYGIVYIGATPTLLKLKTMKGADGKPLKIVQMIAIHDYTTFGRCLLQDENGGEVGIIEKDHNSKGADSVTEAILLQWLTNDVPTRTYQHLIECLRQSETGCTC